MRLRRKVGLDLQSLHFQSASSYSSRSQLQPDRPDGHGVLRLMPQIIQRLRGGVDAVVVRPQRECGEFVDEVVQLGRADLGSLTPFFKF
jgi:hypothetical protein